VEGVPVCGEVGRPGLASSGLAAYVNDVDALLSVCPADAMRPSSLLLSPRRDKKSVSLFGRENCVPALDVTAGLRPRVSFDSCTSQIHGTEGLEVDPPESG